MGGGVFFSKIIYEKIILGIISFPATLLSHKLLLPTYVCMYGKSCWWERFLVLSHSLRTRVGSVVE